MDTWKHYDGWSGGVPILRPFYADAKSPSGGSGRRITDCEWVKTTNAPTVRNVRS